MTIKLNQFELKKIKVNKIFCKKINFDLIADVKPDIKDFPSVAESIKSEKSTDPMPIQERGLKRDASTANIRTPSLQEGKKMKL